MLVRPSLNGRLQAETAEQIVVRNEVNAVVANRYVRRSVRRQIAGAMVGSGDSDASRAELVDDPVEDNVVTLPAKVFDAHENGTFDRLTCHRSRHSRHRP